MGHASFLPGRTTLCRFLCACSMCSMEKRERWEGEGWLNLDIKSLAAPTCQFLLLVHLNPFFLFLHSLHGSTKQASPVFLSLFLSCLVVRLWPTPTFLNSFSASKHQPFTFSLVVFCLWQDFILSFNKLLKLIDNPHFNETLALFFSAFTIRDNHPRWFENNLRWIAALFSQTTSVVPKEKKKRYCFQFFRS